MQIHEIARRNITEGPLKGVATNIVKPVVNYAVDQAKGVAKLPLNTAEYFANKILDTAGVPAAQQGQYSKYGHMAAGQNKGTASIAKAENEIATEIAKEWARLGTLNGQKVELPLDPKQIALAASKLNTGKLQLNTNNIVANVQKMAPEQRSLLDLYKKNPATVPATAPASAPAIAPAIAPAGFNYANVMKLPGMNQPVKKPAPAMAESLIWSKNFDPSKELYRRMKQGQTQ
jgi:hypothetical protein